MPSSSWQMMPGRAGQLDRTGQMQRLAVAIARLDWHFDHVAELRRLKTADCAEDHAVRDIVLSARLLKAEEHIRAGRRRTTMTRPSFPWAISI